MEKEVYNTYQKSKKSRLVKYFYILVILVLLVCSGLFGYLYLQEKQDVQMLADTELETNDIETLKEDVGKHIILDEDEEPTVATIINIDALKEENEEFYRNASNGDKLLIYSKRAIIFSPEKDIIVNIAPIIRQPINDEDSSISVEDESSDE